MSKARSRAGQQAKAVGSKTAGGKPRGLGGRTKAGPSKQFAVKKGTGALKSRTLHKPKIEQQGKPNLVESTNLPAIQPVQSPVQFDLGVKLKLQAVVRDFSTQQPPPGAWPDWIVITAHKYDLTNDQVEHALERLMTGFQSEVRANLHAEAQSLARQIGNIRAKALKVLNEGLEATVEIYPPPVKGEDGEMTIQLPIIKPDHRIRGQFYDRVERLFGMAAPSKAEIDVEVTDRYIALNDEELNQVGAKMLSGFLSVIRARRVSEAGESVADTTVDTTAEKVDD